ncbi:unnamed protein product [Didymodactylos carnosus]|uniref:Uncharacterized protein n=1 Tax=Didymodactylos carnosus TaxID=1234261 RepID=A0A814KWW3_9BILA|nr:unnamed protein product [Didymodactylos carnosus]CAF1056911.1 unnamed protein product [Didymodactylos carnosus]CAF3650114.1 unnamed protein product [Didymodactylos carnosus]CAF3825811.1 unnamed protein product [Didymodactylos carnosus]
MERTSDFPLRIVKTYLSQLVDDRQRFILDDLAKCSESSDEMRHYIHRKLRQIDATPTATSKVQLLKEIFQKFAQRERTKEGLNDLYDFKLKYPNIDIQPYLSSTTESFQKFVSDGLKKIEIERQQQQLSSLPLSESNSTNNSGDGGDTLLSQYTRLHREKTQQLKEQFVWIDTISSSPSSNEQPSSSLQIPDFVPIYNEKMKIIKEKFKTELGDDLLFDNQTNDDQQLNRHRFFDPKLYGQRLDLMRQQCGLTTATSSGAGVKSTVLSSSSSSSSNIKPCG